MTPNVYPDTCQGDEMKSVGQFCIVMIPNLILEHIRWRAIANPHALKEI